MKKIIPIIRLASKFATVLRTTGYREGHLENDAEHSYQLALVCWNANEQYNLSFQDELILKFALVHDLVESYAGDTDAHDTQEALASKKDREIEAFQMLKIEYKQFEDMIHTIERYERKNDPEAQLVYLMDKLIPDVNVHFGRGDYYHSRKINLADWKKWLLRKINRESLHPKLIALLDESIREIETNFKDTFYQEKRDTK